jgi:hypothetical protein
VLGGEETNTNCIAFGIILPGSNPRSTALEASTRPITPPMQFCKLVIQTNLHNLFGWKLQLLTIPTGWCFAYYFITLVIIRFKTVIAITFTDMLRMYAFTHAIKLTLPISWKLNYSDLATIVYLDTFASARQKFYVHKKCTMWKHIAIWNRILGPRSEVKLIIVRMVDWYIQKIVFVGVWYNHLLSAVDRTRASSVYWRKSRNAIVSMGHPQVK